MNTVNVVKIGDKVYIKNENTLISYGFAYTLKKAVKVANEYESSTIYVSAYSISNIHGNNDEYTRARLYVLNDDLNELCSFYIRYDDVIDFIKHNSHKLGDYIHHRYGFDDFEVVVNDTRFKVTCRILQNYETQILHDKIYYEQLFKIKPSFDYTRKINVETEIEMFMKLC